MRGSARSRKFEQTSLTRRIPAAAACHAFGEANDRGQAESGWVTQASVPPASAVSIRLLPVRSRRRGHKTRCPPTTPSRAPQRRATLRRGRRRPPQLFPPDCPCEVCVILVAVSSALLGGKSPGGGALQRSAPLTLTCMRWGAPVLWCCPQAGSACFEALRDEMDVSQYLRQARCRGPPPPAPPPPPAAAAEARARSTRLRHSPPRQYLHSPSTTRPRPRFSPPEPLNLFRLLS